jgi:hypothetical protein
LAINISSKKYNLRYNLSERRCEVGGIKRGRIVTIGKWGGRKRWVVALKFSQLLSQEIAGKGFRGAKVETIEQTPLFPLKLKVRFSHGDERKLWHPGGKSKNLSISLPAKMVPGTLLGAPLLLRTGGAGWVNSNVLSCWFPGPLKEVKIEKKDYIGSARISHPRQKLLFSSSLSPWFAKLRGLEVVAEGKNVFLFLPQKDCFFSCKECPNPRCFPLHPCGGSETKRKAQQYYICTGLLNLPPSSQGKVFRYGKWLGVEF